MNDKCNLFAVASDLYLLTHGSFFPRSQTPRQFDAALLTNAEFKQGPNAWMQLPYPFPQWLPNETQAS